MLMQIKNQPIVLITKLQIISHDNASMATGVLGHIHVQLKMYVLRVYTWVILHSSWFVEIWAICVFFGQFVCIHACIYIYIYMQYTYIIYI